MFYPNGDTIIRVVKSEDKNAQDYKLFLELLKITYEIYYISISFPEVTKKLNENISRCHIFLQEHLQIIKLRVIPVTF